MGYMHDPDGRYLEGYSPIGDPAVDLRDPVFFRLHAYVDDLFQEHKQRLTPVSWSLSIWKLNYFFDDLVD